MMKKAKRIQQVPPYLFAQIDKMKAEKIAQGVDVINLGIGDPDQPTPQHIIDCLVKAVNNPQNHQYPSYDGMLSFRKAVADWYIRRFSLRLDPDKQVLTLIGSKEGIAHLPLAFVDPGDYVLIPDPAYPVYNTATLFAGGIPYTMPLLAENNFLPDLSAIDPEILPKTKMMFINYPNNPTAAVATKEFFAEVVAFAKKHEIIVCHDFAYSEIAFDGYNPPSFLETPGALDVGVEFNSLSKPYNMTGWRIGFVVGNEKVIEGLSIIKTNTDSGVFQAVQYAGIEALMGPQDIIQDMVNMYEGRRDVVIDGLNEIGWKLEKSKGTFYVWAPVPEGFNCSKEFAAMLLDKAGVVVTPGVGYGEYGEGYFRIALTVNEDRLRQAVQRIQDVLTN